MMYSQDRLDQSRLKYKESTNPEERETKRLKSCYSPSANLQMQSFTLTAVSTGLTLRHQDDLRSAQEPRPDARYSRGGGPDRQPRSAEELLHHQQQHQHQQSGRIHDDDIKMRSRTDEDRDEDVVRYSSPSSHQDLARDRRLVTPSSSRNSRSVNPPGGAGLGDQQVRVLDTVANTATSTSSSEALNLGRSDSRSSLPTSMSDLDAKLIYKDVTLDQVTKDMRIADIRGGDGGGPDSSRISGGSGRHADSGTGPRMHDSEPQQQRVFKEPRNVQENLVDNMKEVGRGVDPLDIEPGKAGSSRDHDQLRSDLSMDYEDEARSSGRSVDRTSILEYSRSMEMSRTTVYSSEYSSSSNNKEAMHRGYSGYEHKNDNNQYGASSWRSRGADSKRMSSTTTDQYCLKWNSYESNILDTFGGLLDSEALSDVTLFCEGESFKAHRLVLAACSTHFSKIFSSAPLNGQLIVILDGTRAEDLQILLQFMYRGVAFLPSDRIESVLRTGEVLQVKGLFNGGGGGEAGARNTRSGSADRAWSPQPPDSIKKDVDGASGRPDRDPGSPVPSGRIAVQGESPITHNLPIFPQQPYPRPFTSLPSIYPSTFPFSRPESAGSKTTSSSVHSFPGAKSGGGGRNAAVSPPPSSVRDTQFSKLPLDRDGRAEVIPEFSIKSEIGKIRSPPIHRPSSEPYDRSTPRSTGGGAKLSTAGGDADMPGSSSPSQSRPRFDDSDRQRMKTESSPPPRERTFSGDYSEAARESLSRLSSASKSSNRTAADTAEDLRTNDTEERIKRENNQDFLRRLAQVNSERENQLATIQKMDLLRQATARGDHFLAGAGGFSGPLTAPLTALPASDLARIAQSVPDPAAIPGEPTSGTGTKLKCPFCERTYGYETNLRAHIRQRHQGIRVPCPYCHRTFTRNNTVRRHIAREHRNHVNPKMIPAKFGQTKVLPDQPYLDTINSIHQQSSPQP